MPLEQCQTCGSDALIYNLQEEQMCGVCGAHANTNVQIGEYDDGLSTTITKLGIKGRVTQDVVWSSFEGFNIILNEWCNVLVRLGVSKTVYDGVFAVWFKYLEQCNIFSDDGKKTIRHTRDLIYFGKMKKKEKDREHTMDSVTDKASKKFSGHDNATYVSKHLNETLQEQDDDLQLIYEYLADEEQISEEQNNPDKGNIDFTLKSSSGGGYRANFFSKLAIDKLLALFYLGIRMAEVDVCSFDIIRWCRQGILPYFSAASLLRESRNLTVDDVRMLQKPLTCAEQMRFFSGLYAVYLSLPLVPLPVFAKVWERLVEELRLPEETNDICQHIFCLVGPMQQSMLAVPNVEVVAACFIVLALKITFGIDNNQEVILSHWADKVNKEKDRQKRGGHHFFSFLKWQRFIDKTHWWHRQTSYNGIFENSSTYECDKLVSYFYGNEGKNFINKKPRAWTKQMSDSLYGMSDSKVTIEDSSPKTLFSPFNGTTGVFSQYIANNEQYSPPKHLLDAAKELEATSFKDNVLDWVVRSDEIERTFSDGKYEVSLVSVAFNEIITRHRTTLRTFQSSDTTRVLLPDPKLSFWQAKEYTWAAVGEGSELPTNFRWIISVFAKLCEISNVSLYRKYASMEKCFCTRSTPKG